MKWTWKNNYTTER